MGASARLPGPNKRREIGMGDEAQGLRRHLLPGLGRQVRGATRQKPPRRLGPGLRRQLGQGLEQAVDQPAAAEADVVLAPERRQHPRLLGESRGGERALGQGLRRRGQGEPALLGGGDRARAPVAAEIGLGDGGLGPAQDQRLAGPARQPQLRPAVEGRRDGDIGQAVADQLIPGPLGGLIYAAPAADIEPVLGPGQGDIEQAPLLLGDLALEDGPRRGGQILVVIDPGRPEQQLALAGAAPRAGGRPGSGDRGYPAGRRWAPAAPWRHAPS